MRVQAQERLGDGAKVIPAEGGCPKPKCYLAVCTGLWLACFYRLIALIKEFVAVSWVQTISIIAIYFALMIAAQWMIEGSSHFLDQAQNDFGKVLQSK